MAKVGKPRVALGDEFVKQAWDILEPQLEEKARKAQSHLPADVDTGVQMTRDRNGRPVALLSILHPSGLARQAKHGDLTRAAAAEGMDVHRYPRR